MNSDQINRTEWKKNYPLTFSGCQVFNEMWYQDINIKKYVPILNIIVDFTHVQVLLLLFTISFKGNLSDIAHGTSKMLLN